MTQARMAIPANMACLQPQLHANVGRLPERIVQ
jgi:hypothetical protein